MSCRSASESREQAKTKKQKKTKKNGKTRNCPLRVSKGGQCILRSKKSHFHPSKTRKRREEEKGTQLITHRSEVQIGDAHAGKETKTTGERSPSENSHNQNWVRKLFHLFLRRLDRSRRCRWARRLVCIGRRLGQRFDCQTLQGVIQNGGLRRNLGRHLLDSVQRVENLHRHCVRIINDGMFAAQRIGKAPHQIGGALKRRRHKVLGLVFRNGKRSLLNNARTVRWRGRMYRLQKAGSFSPRRQPRGQRALSQACRSHTSIPARQKTTASQRRKPEFLRLRGTLQTRP